MSATAEILAVVFDFDDTLIPDSTTLFLKSNKIDTEAFWGKEAKALLENGFDPTLGYLQLILDRTGKGKPLGLLTRRKLYEFGKTLDKYLYQGVPKLCKDLRSIVAKYPRIDIEFYIISSGLLDIIRGSKIIRDYFKAVYACEFHEGSEKCISKIKRCVSFTEKTRYLFEINKGLSVEETHTNPYLVNKDIPESERRISFRNMIYVGDGLTDIPCFSLITKSNGTAFGVFHPGKEHSAKRAFLEFLKTDRVVSCHAPKFGKNDELGSLLRTAVTQRCEQIRIDRQGAVSGR